MSTQERARIADELMFGCPEESRDAHQRIADAVRGGTSVDAVLDMCEDWPDTYAWLKGEMREHEKPTPDMLEVLAELTHSMEVLIAERPMLAARVAAHTTIGNTVAEARAVIIKARGTQ